MPGSVNLFRRRVGSRRRSPTKEVVSALADLLADMHSGVALGTRLFPGICRGRRFRGCLLLDLGSGSGRCIGLTQGTLGVDTRRRIGPFSAHRASCVIRLNNHGDGLFGTHDGVLHLRISAWPVARRAKRSSLRKGPSAGCANPRAHRNPHRRATPRIRTPGTDARRPHTGDHPP
jgi:hypothetical protein